MCYNRFDERGNRMKNISDSVADMLWTQGIIQEDDIDKCKYGINIFFSSFFEIFSILLIAAFIGNFIETLLLFGAFIPLRIYAGGYHADTKMKCYLISLGMYGVLCIMTKYIPYNIYQTIYEKTKNDYLLQCSSEVRVSEEEAKKWYISNISVNMDGYEKNKDMIITKLEEEKIRCVVSRLVDELKEVSEIKIYER